MSPIIRELAVQLYPGAMPCFPIQSVFVAQPLCRREPTSTILLVRFRINYRLVSTIGGRFPCRTLHHQGSRADTGNNACGHPPDPSSAVGHPPCILAPSLATHKCFCILPRRTSGSIRAESYGFEFVLLCQVFKGVGNRECFGLSDKAVENPCTGAQGFGLHNSTLSEMDRTCALAL
jgi:hypothetical protein